MKCVVEIYKEDMYMALIQCPECGHNVSDKAAMCPMCGFAVAANRPDGTVRIMISQQELGLVRRRVRQKAQIISEGSVLWEGMTGQIAEIYCKGPTPITVIYKGNLDCSGSECNGMIDPKEGKSYKVFLTINKLNVLKEMYIQRVDAIDR